MYIRATLNAECVFLCFGHCSWLFMPFSAAVAALDVVFISFKEILFINYFSSEKLHSYSQQRVHVVFSKQNATTITNSFFVIKMNANKNGLLRFASELKIVRDLHNVLFYIFILKHAPMHSQKELRVRDSIAVPLLIHYIWTRLQYEIQLRW